MIDDIISVYRKKFRLFHMTSYHYRYLTPNYDIYSPEFIFGVVS